MLGKEFYRLVSKMNQTVELVDTEKGTPKPQDFSLLHSFYSFSRCYRLVRQALYILFFHVVLSFFHKTFDGTAPIPFEHTNVLRSNNYDKHSLDFKQRK